jgi:hypothetical protein
MIFIGTPMYDKATAAYVHTMMRLVGKRIDLAYHAEVGDCMIEHARNTIVRRFLDSPADVLLFIDADQGASPDDLIRTTELARNVRGVVALPCPVRNRPNVWCVESSVDVGHIPDSGAEGISMMAVGTGIMAIHRSVFESLSVSRYRDDDGSDVGLYFCCEVVGGVFQGEDWTFCKKVREFGHPVLVVNPKFMKEKVTHG